jgi:hypothetical protein
MLYLLVILNFSLEGINSLICGCCIPFLLQTHGFLKTKLSETIIDTSYSDRFKVIIPIISYNSNKKGLQ